MHTTKPIIIGHSLGPAVGMKMHALYPEKVGGSIHVAGEFSPDDMIIWRVSYPMHTKLLSRAFPRFLRSTNAEKITHPHEL